MRTLLLSTVMIGAWTTAALAEPAAPTTTPARQATAVAATTKAATSQQAPKGRVELDDAQMDTLKAGGGGYWTG